MLTLWAGLATGAIYVMVAVAFNVVHVASGTFNFAQPQYLMLGTFVSYWVVVTHHLPVVVAIVAGVLSGAAVGAVEYLVAVRLLSGSAAHGELVTTVGWSVVVQGVVLLLWGSDPLRVPGLGADHYVDLFGGRLSVNDLLLIFLALALGLGVHVWFRRTRAGIASLAAAEDPQAATVRGINTTRLSIVAFAVGGAVLGALGPAVAPKTFAVYTLGTVLVLKAFVAMSVGGFGSFTGTLIGGFAIGVVEAEVERYWGASYVNLSIFVLLIGVLMFRPQGLFGQQRERVV
jgi:branched-chain amino acid transport system permease protein